VLVDRCRSKEGRKFALKIIRKERISGEQELALGAELALLRRLRHPGLIQLVDELDTPAEWYFVMELFSVCVHLCVRLSVFLPFFHSFYDSVSCAVGLSK